jgi:glycosyltransferase involved in cell wall biosynthesis
MRILFVSDVYLPRVNGVSTSIRSFRGSLESLGHEVRLVVPRYGDESPEQGVTRVPSTPVPFDPEDRRLHRAALRAACRAAAADCDVVHAQTPFLAYYAARDAARHVGRPLVVSYHTYFEGYLHHYVPFLPRPFAAWFARHFSRAQCNAADALVVPTRAIRELLAGYGVARPTHVVPTGLDLPLYRDADGAGFRRALGIAPDVPLALHLGRLAHEKNVGFVISAFARVHARMPTARLLIAGEGPATADLQAQVARLGLAEAVTFIGYLTDRRSVAACYAAADAFLFASQTETQGLVLLEAMASGTPVVSVAALGAVEVLPETSGAVVVPPDVVAFGDAAGAVLGDADRRAAIVTRQHAFVAEWSEAAMTHRLLEVYQGVLADHPAAIVSPICEEA